MDTKLLSLTALLFLMQPLFAAVHYVSPGGTATWEQSIDINTPCSLHVANVNLLAGDTAYLREGTYLGGLYRESISPRKSGTSGARILYSNYNDEKVTITEAKGIDLNNKSYVTVKGMDFTYVDGYFGMTDSGSHHNIIEYCTFEGMRKYKWQAALIQMGAHHNRVNHCKLSKWGYQDTSGTHRGVLLDITTNSDYNIIENCMFLYSQHHVIGVMGSYNVIRNNYFQNFEWEQDPEGYRGLYFCKETSMRNLFEGNRVAFTGTKGCGFRLETPYNIIRLNCFYLCKRPGITIYGNGEGTPNCNYICNNTFYHNGYTTIPYDGDNQKSAINFCKAFFYGTVVKNNIFHDNNVGSYGFSDVNVEDQIIANNWEEEGDPLFIDDETPLDPVDPRYPDFQLQTKSPCIDRGGFLTTIKSESGSGTQLEVDDAGSFMDGWGIIEGDEIQLEDSSQKARIKKIDYSTNTITLDKSVTWTQNMGVSLAYSGSAPDLGAHEYTGVVQIQNFNHKNNTLTPQISIYQNPSRGLVTIQISKISPTLTIGSKLRIYDLSGILVDELELRDGKFFWNNSSVSTGIYLMRLEGTKNYLGQRLLLMR